MTQETLSRDDSWTARLRNAATGGQMDKGACTTPCADNRPGRVDEPHHMANSNFSHSPYANKGA